MCYRWMTVGAANAVAHGASKAAAKAGEAVKEIGEKTEDATE